MSVRLESFRYLPRGADGWGSRLLHFGEMFLHALTRLAVDRERALDVIHGEAGAQGNAFGRDDVTQFLTLGAHGFDIAFRDETLEMPVDRANGNAKLRGKRGLVDLGVVFYLFEQGQLAEFFVGRFHNFKIQ